MSIASVTTPSSPTQSTKLDADRPALQAHPGAGGLAEEHPAVRPEAHVRDAAAAREREPKIVSERLGHSTITLTLDTYSHVLPTMQRAAADQLEQMLFG